jgi:hypothetical protein
MRKFTEEEIREILRSAQVCAPSFSDDQYRKLVELGQDLADSEFIEAAWGVHRLQHEYGTPCSEASDKYLQLLRDKAQLESQVSHLQEKRKLEEERLAETVEATRRSRAERNQQERELKSFKREAEKEKKRFKKEVEVAMEKARVNQEEIATAGRLKAAVESHGLDLELALGLLSEFAGDKDAARHLAEAVAEYGSQLEARTTLREQNEALKAQIEEEGEQFARVKADCQQHEETLSRLRSDLAQEEALHRFHSRFKGWSGLLECLARWDQVILLRCHWFFCGARFWVDRGPTSFRSKLICPCCGVSQLYFDDEPFMAIGIPDRGPIKIQLE